MNIARKDNIGNYVDVPSKTLSGALIRKSDGSPYYERFYKERNLELYMWAKKQKYIQNTEIEM